MRTPFDFGELYDLATAISYKELENLTKDMCKILALLKVLNWPRPPKKLVCFEKQECLPDAKPILRRYQEIWQ